jgi:predicted lipoprotein with Yx(FWY)xxD motif
MLAAAGAALSLTGALADEFAGGAIHTMDTDKGEVLTDAKGMTLYIFDKDTAGVTNCYNQCAINWPPLVAADGAMADGDYTLVDRTDGAKQWAHKGMPLYLWKDDHAPGDVTGDGVGGVWHIVMKQ